MYSSLVAIAPHASLRGRRGVVTGLAWTRDGTAAGTKCGMAQFTSVSEKSPNRQVVHPVSSLSGELPFLLFKHEITHVHKVSSVNKWLFEFGVEEHDWPAQSPDLNPGTAPLRKQT